MLCILFLNTIMHSTLLYCLSGVQDHTPDSKPLFKNFCFLMHSINFAWSWFVFMTMWFSFLHYQVSAPSTGYLVRWRNGTTRVIVLPVNVNNTFLKSHLCCAYWSQSWLCIQPCLMYTRGTRSNSRVDPIVYLFYSLTHSIKFALSRFAFKTRWFSFLHYQVSSPSAGYLARWRNGTTRVIVLPVHENNTFLKVIYAVHIDLKRDYAFKLVLTSTRG